MLTLYEFNLLPDIELQAEYLWENGIYLHYREEKQKRIALYSLGNFYVEVWLDEQGKNIVKLRSFKTTEQLESYLPFINLQNLI